MGWDTVSLVLPPGLFVCVLWIDIDGYIKGRWSRCTSAQTECLNITETQFGYCFEKCSHFLYQMSFRIYKMPYAAQHNWTIANFIRDVKFRANTQQLTVTIILSCQVIWELIFSSMHVISTDGEINWSFSHNDTEIFIVQLHGKRQNSFVLDVWHFVNPSYWRCNIWHLEQQKCENVCYQSLMVYSMQNFWVFFFLEKPLTVLQLHLEFKIPFTM